MESTKGFVVCTSNEAEEKSAEALSMSIKLKNPDANVAIIVKNVRTTTIDEDTVDYIIEYPFSKDRSTKENVWQTYWASPFDNTIVLNPYSLVCENLDNTWDYLIERHDLCFSKTRLDFRGFNLGDDPSSYYVEENVNHINSDMFYFKKRLTALEFFNLMDVYSKYWKVIYNKLLKPEHQTDDFDLDLLMSLALKMLDFDNTISRDDSILTTISTDTITQELIKDGKVENIFTEYLNIWLRKDSNIKIHNFIVNGTLCYDSPLFLTEEIYENYRKNYARKKFRETVVD